MGVKMVVQTAFTMADKMSGPLGKITGNFKKAFSSIASQVAIGNLAAKGISSLIGGLRSVTAQFIDFDAAVVQSGALFKDLDSTSADFKDSLAAIGAEARRVAAATEFNAVDTAGALQKMAMAGMTSKQSMELLMGTTNLATAAGTNLTTAVDIATDALGAFGMAATKGNLQRVSDVMAKTASSFNTDLTMMFESIKNAGPSFTAAGQSIDTLAASIGVLANAGIKGSDAGTALNAVFTQLKSGAKKDAIEKLIGPVTDAKGNFIDLIEIVGKLQGKLQGMGNAQQGEILSGIFGTRGEKAMNLLLQTGVDDLRKFKEEMAGSAGAAAQMADVMRGSIKNQIEVLKSSLTELGFKFIEAFKERGSAALDSLIKTVQKIDPTKIIDFLSDALDLVIEFGPAILAVVVAFNAWKTSVEIIGGVTIALNAFKAAQAAGAVATGGATGAMAAFNAVIAANPIGAIISAAVIGVTLLITLIAMLSKKVGGLKNAFIVVFQTINRVIGMFLNPIYDLIQNILTVTRFLPGELGAVSQALYNKMQAFQDKINTMTTGSADYGITHLGDSYSTHRSAELARQESEKEEKTLEALNRIADLEQKNIDATNGLAAASAQGVPGRLSYSQMGREDWWSIAREGL
jgi:TP901 family phage tail tape measure protein